MKSREELVLKEELPEWDKAAGDFFRSDPGEMLLGKLWRTVGGIEQSILATDITTDEGIKKSLELRGTLKGLLVAIELLLERKRDERTE